jgi:hypothetical protein
MKASDFGRSKKRQRLDQADTMIEGAICPKNGSCNITQLLNPVTDCKSSLHNRERLTLITLHAVAQRHKLSPSLTPKLKQVALLDTQYQISTPTNPLILRYRRETLSLPIFRLLNIRLATAYPHSKQQAKVKIYRTPLGVPVVRPGNVASGITSRQDTILSRPVMRSRMQAEEAQACRILLSRAIARASLAMRRSGSVENKPNAMACNTSGWTHVASTDQTTPSSRKLSTLCFASTVVRLDATSICQMF